MPEQPANTNIEDDPRQHPRFQEYLDACNKLWNLATNPSETKPTFKEWLLSGTTTNRTVGFVDTQAEKAQAQTSPEQIIKPETLAAPPPPQKTATQKKQDEELRRFTFETENHPKFKAWLAEMKILQDNQVPVSQCLPFHRWLEFKAAEEITLRNRPRIRSANPPKGNATAGNDIFNRIFRPRYAKEMRAPWKLVAYPVDFPLLLADGSPIEITLHFEIPEGYHTPQLTDQLNVVTEKFLMIFVANRTESPKKHMIDDYLSLVLVQFQNEHQLPILRVEAIPLPPLPKPTRGNRLNV